MDGQQGVVLKVCPALEEREVKTWIPDWDLGKGSDLDLAP